MNRVRIFGGYGKGTYNRQENCKFRALLRLFTSTGHSYFRDLLFFNSNNSIFLAWEYKIPAESLTLYNGCSTYIPGTKRRSPTLMYNNSSPAPPDLASVSFQRETFPRDKNWQLYNIRRRSPTLVSSWCRPKVLVIQ